MIKQKYGAGPNPYVSDTGAVITFGEFQKINSAVAKCSQDNVLAVNDRAYALKTVIDNASTGPQVKVLVYALNTSGGGQAWAQLAAGDMHLLTFTVTVDAE